MPDIGQPSASDKNSDAEIRDAVVSDATRFPGGFIDEQITEAGASVQIVGQFQLNNAGFDRSFDVSDQDGTPEGLAFSPDGGQLYIAGDNTNRVYEYSLSTAFDVSTASVVHEFNVNSEESIPKGLAFNPDGSQLYVTGTASANVNEYSLSTAFDISTASFVQLFDVSGQDSRPQGLAFNPDGSQLYVVGTAKINVNEYSLSTAFDISTASFVQSLDISGQDSDPTGLTFKPDGSQFYLVGKFNDNVYQYSLSTAFDISSASFSRSFDVSGQDAIPTGLAFSPDGGQLYVAGDKNNKVYQYAVGFVGAELG